MLNPGTYNMGSNCRPSNTYVKIFGTAQNYEDLIKSDPGNVANSISGTVNRLSNKIIVDWKYPLTGQIQQSRLWLNKFIEALEGHNVETYLKAPASYFCYKK